MNRRCEHIHLKSVWITSAFLMICVVLNFSWSQKYANYEIEAEIHENEAYFKSQISYLQVFGNLISFKESTFVGLKTINSDQIVLPAVYDSIIATDGYRFITVKGSEYKLLDTDLWNWLDSNAVQISYLNGFYTVVDTDNKVSRYQVLYEGTQIMPLDNPINHWVYKPQSTENNTQNYYRNTFPFEDAFVDSIQFVRTPNKAVVLFKNGSEYCRINGDFNNYTIFGKDHLCLSTRKDDFQQFQVYDLTNRELIFSVEAVDLSHFEYQGVNYIRAEISTDSKQTRIFTMEGKLVVESDEKLEFAQGILFKKESQPYPSHLMDYTLYTFPGGRIIESGINNVEYYYPFVLAYRKAFEGYNVYFQGELLHTFKSKGNTTVSSYGIFPNTNDGVVSIKTDDAKGKNSHYLLISTKGKLLAESDRSISCYYNEPFDQIKVHLNQKGKGYREIVGIYRPERDSLEMIPFKDSNWEQVNANTLLYDEMHYNKKQNQYTAKIYFVDLKGNRLNEDVFSDRNTVGDYSKGILYVELLKNNVPVIYNSDLKQLCDSCYFEELKVVNWKSGEFVVAQRNMNNIYTQVYNQNMELVLPEKYLAVTYNAYIKHFIVLTKDNEIKFIPLSETILSEK